MDRRKCFGILVKAGGVGGRRAGQSPQSQRDRRDEHAAGEGVCAPQVDLPRPEGWGFSTIGASSLKTE
jgi:hypothetical protein